MTGVLIRDNLDMETDTHRGKMMWRQGEEPAM